MPLFAADPALHMAEELASNGNYQASITEYKRYLFFNPTVQDISSVYLQLGITCYLAALPDEGDKAFAQALDAASDDVSRNRLRIDVAIQYLAHDRSSQAESLLLRVVAFDTQAETKQRAWFFLGVAYVQTHQWSDAQDAFDHAFPAPDAPEARAIHELLNPSRLPRLKSPRRAKQFSTFLPGSGQIYAGDWKNGINALLLNLLTGFSVVSPLMNGEYSTAFSDYYTFFDRYYRGNRYNAERIANEKNASRVATFTQQTLANILRIVQETESFDQKTDTVPGAKQ